MHSLWDEPVPAFQGRFVEFADVVQRPRPVQRPHPPVVIGGESPSALRRAVLAGDGWYGWELDPDATAKALAELRAAAERHQRPAELGELEITITPPQGLDLDMARRYADLGVDRLAIVPPTMQGTAIDDLIAWAGDTLAGKV
jgi:alkanesulfonate monooxygenase SsuD/methylene tetrahydromethanopterin reductase-like flavin-dependent oxidoreductase (luciferase family)